jgi:hypothetical protein
MMLTAKPVWSKNVLNEMPRLSPQLTMQKQLKTTTKKTSAVRGRPIAIAARTPKTSEVTISKGSSSARY